MPSASTPNTSIHFNIAPASNRASAPAAGATPPPSDTRMDSQPPAVTASPPSSAPSACGTLKAMKASASSAVAPACQAVARNASRRPANVGSCTLLDSSSGEPGAGGKHPVKPRNYKHRPPARQPARCGKLNGDSRLGMRMVITCGLGPAPGYWTRTQEAHRHGQDRKLRRSPLHRRVLRRDAPDREPPGRRVAGDRGTGLQHGGLPPAREVLEAPRAAAPAQR